MNDLITEARELCEKATPGPWKVVENKSFAVQSDDKNIASCFRRENEEFIARARTIIPELCDLIESLQVQLANAQVHADCMEAKAIAFEQELAASQRREKAAVEDMTHDIVRRGKIYDRPPGGAK